MSIAMGKASLKAQMKAVQEESGALVEFDEEIMRHWLINGAGRELSLVAKSVNKSLTGQTDAIRRSAKDFDGIIQRMSVVQESVRGIDSSIDLVVQDAEITARELQTVSAKMQALEEQFSSIDELVAKVNGIADKSHLLALNASIEAARAGEMGKGFGVVANEVKELSGTTKETNHVIRETLAQIGTSVQDLSRSVSESLRTMEKAIETVNATRTNATTIDQETTHFSSQLATSLEHFDELAASSSHVENEISEVTTIGDTFHYLLELMTAQGLFRESTDPLERLGPVVAQSTFYDPQRFTGTEREYTLTDQDILISATDPKGIITFANNRFYEIAEYLPGELVGRPHNVIRHPDMPKTAFADLWAVIQTGKTWQGYVKNVSKTGRVYWVKAGVFPCFEQGKIVGYISVRTKPEPAKIRQAIEAYRRVP